MPRHLWIHLIAALVFLVPSKSSAHITSTMPDPIAKVEYQMMLEFEPDDYETRYKLAMVFFRLAKMDQAEEELQKVLHAHPDYFHALEGLGILRLSQKRYNEALELLTKAAALKNAESGTYFYLGQAYLGLHDAKRARMAFETGRTLCGTEDEKKRAQPLARFDEALQDLASEKTVQPPRTKN